MASLLPDDFRFGVATSGFQIEGGYNGPGEPRNNWHGWEAAGRVEPSGVAVRFWDEPEALLDRAAAAGCDSFRLSVEWARVEPTEGEIDEDALTRYAAILGACHDRDMRPLVTLHHFTHPHWLGEDFWLSPDSPERYLAWVQRAVAALGDRCRDWVTINEINVYAVQTYLTGMFPPGRRLATGAVIRALDHMLAAHVLAYAAIHAVQDGASVSTNNYPLSVYEVDRLLVDVLMARHVGVARHDLSGWLVARRRDHYAAISADGWRESALRRLSASAVPLEQALPRAVAAVYDSRHERCLDNVQIDYYDPVASNHFRMPGHRTAGGRNWLPGRMLWDDPPDPRGLVEWSRVNAEPGLPLLIVENGLCNRVRNGRSYPRGDGWDRPRYLRENLAAMVDAVDAGLPVQGYWHWTLADNYEWGSYEPRFGLHGVDRDRGVRLLDTDAMGDDAAGTYRRIIEGLRAGNRTVLTAQ